MGLMFIAAYIAMSIFVMRVIRKRRRTDQDETRNAIIGNVATTLVTGLATQLVAAPVPFWGSCPLYVLLTFPFVVFGALIFIHRYLDERQKLLLPKYITGAI